MRLKTKNVDDLVRSFMEKRGIQRGHGGTPLPAALGPFLLYPTLIEALGQEHLTVEKRRDGPVMIFCGSSPLTRRFSSRSEPEIWIRPQPTIDYHVRSIVCQLVINTCSGDVFPLTVHRKICRAVAIVYPDCHTLIREAADNGFSSEPWGNLGFGDIIPLSEIFDYFAGENELLKTLVRTGLGIFNPYPSRSTFVERRESACILGNWHSQFDKFRSSLYL